MNIYGYQKNKLPIAWKYPDPIEIERWVYDESDYIEITLNGGMLLDVITYRCADCGKIIIESHPDTDFRDYDYAMFIGNEPFCPDCFYK